MKQLSNRDVALGHWRIYASLGKATIWQRLEKPFYYTIELMFAVIVAVVVGWWVIQEIKPETRYVPAGYVYIDADTGKIINKKCTGAR